MHSKTHGMYWAIWLIAAGMIISAISVVMLIKPTASAETTPRPMPTLSATATSKPALEPPSQSTDTPQTTSTNTPDVSAQTPTSDTQNQESRIENPEPGSSTQAIEPATQNTESRTENQEPGSTGMNTGFDSQVTSPLPTPVSPLATPEFEPVSGITEHVLDFVTIVETAQADHIAAYGRYGQSLPGDPAGCPSDQNCLAIDYPDIEGLAFSINAYEIEGEHGYEIVAVYNDTWQVVINYGPEIWRGHGWKELVQQ